MKNELYLGGWLSFFSFVAIFASFIFGRYVKYKYCKNLILSGGILYFLLVILIILFPSFWVYILFGSLYNLADLFIKIPKRVISENLIHSLEDENNHRVEYIVIREWFNIGLGRVLSFILLLGVGVLEVEKMQILLILMAIAVLGEAMILKTIRREVQGC